MKPEQRMGIIFAAFGFAMGLLSNFVHSLGVIFSTVVPIVGYVAMLFVMKSAVEKSKKPKWLVTNSVLVFLLMWIVVWIFVFNIR